jgi:F-box/leucine-rich repeat protein 2/20
MPLLSNIVLQALASTCKKLSRLEVGALPNDYSDDISLEGIESLLMLKRPYGLKIIRIEYCTKIGDRAIEALTKRFGYCIEEFSIIRNYYEKAAKISDEAFKYL